MGYGNTSFESFFRAGRTAYFMVIMLGSLVSSSSPWLVSLVDILIPCAILSTVTCCASFFSVRMNWSHYSFRSSLIDVPILSLVRSFAAICAYGVCDIPSLCHGPYLTTAGVFGFVSGVFLVAKACLFSIPKPSESPNTVDVGYEHLKHVWGLPLMFSSSMVLAFGHVVIAYRARCQARRRLSFHRADEEAVLICKLGTHAFHRQVHYASPRFVSKLGKDGEKISRNNENDLPASMLAEADSLFMKCKGLLVHYKLFDGGTKNVKMNGYSSDTGSGFSHNHSFESAESENFSCVLTQNVLKKAQSNGYNSESLHAPLLASTVEMNHMSYDSLCRLNSPSSLNVFPVIGKKFQASHTSETEAQSRSPKPGRVEARCGHQQIAYEGQGVLFIHGFGGGVFSWRHVMGPLAKQTGCIVAGLDRPGWGLTSRPSRKEWEKKGLPNPYELHSQVDLILAFCRELGLKSVVLVGHDDGGMLALMTAAKASQDKDYLQVDVRGVVLVGVSLSREVVPGFARVLLHTSLGRHMLRPLLRSEIGQVANRRAWHDSSKLTSEVLDLYKVPLRVEGWDRALAEVTKPSASGALPSNCVEDLLRLVGNLPALLIAGVQDRLVPLKAAETLASRFSECKIVAIPGCGHLPPEESPGALLTAVLPFVSSLLDTSLSVQSALYTESSLCKICG